QARTDRVPSLDLEEDSSRGRTRLDTDALTDAVTDEVESYRGVEAATARLMDKHAAPWLSPRVRLDGRVPPGEVCRRIEADAIAHSRTALSAEALPARVELIVPRRPPAGPTLSAPER